MDKKTLIELAANSKMLRNLCRKLCNYRDIQNDLFQEFLIHLLTRDEAYLLEKYNKIEFIHYCVNTIRGFNSNRIKANKCINSSNPLTEKCNNFDLLDFDIQEEMYNFDIDIKFNKTISCLKGINKDRVFLKSRKELVNDGLTYRQITYQKQLAKEHVLKHIK